MYLPKVAENPQPCAGSAVKELALSHKLVPHSSLQAVLVDYSGLCSLDLCFKYDVTAEDLANLIHFPHIRCVAVAVRDLSSLQSVHTATHLEELSVRYNDFVNQGDVPQLPCAYFSRLTSLKVSTAYEKPGETFQYLSQLQKLKNLSLGTAAPKNVNYPALSRLTSLQMDNADVENLEALQQLPKLRQLELSGHPTDTEILMVANVTQLTDLYIEAINHEDVTCHLSSVVMLTSLVNRKSLNCDIVDGSAHYSICMLTMEDGAHPAVAAGLW